MHAHTGALVSLAQRLHCEHLACATLTHNANLQAHAEANAFVCGCCLAQRLHCRYLAGATLTHNANLQAHAEANALF
jgi:hypothetical protein